MNYGYTDSNGILLAYDTTGKDLSLAQAQALIPEITDKYSGVPSGLKVRYSNEDVRLSPLPCSYHQLIGGDWIEITDLRGMKFLKCAEIREIGENHIAESTFSYGGKEFRLDIPKKNLYNSVMIAANAGALTVPTRVQTKYYETITLNTIAEVQNFWGSAVAAAYPVYEWIMDKCDEVMSAPFESSVNAVVVDDLP